MLPQQKYTLLPCLAPNSPELEVHFFLKDLHYYKVAHTVDHGVRVALCAEKERKRRERTLQ